MVTFRRVPDEQIAAAHAAKAAASAPAPPRVRNAEALVALGEPRGLRWKGHYYHVPPLPFGLAMKLLVLAQVLASSHTRAQKAALRTARALLCDCVYMRRNPFRRVTPDNLRHPWRNPFRRINSVEARTLIDDLLQIPDDSPTISGKGGGAADLLDGYLAFIERFPALVGADGMPVSWAHYQYGVRHLPRLAARDLLRSVQSVRIGQWTGEAPYKAFTAEQERLAGWVH